MVVKFTGSDFKESLEVVKSLFGFSFSKPMKTWVGPVTQASIDKVREAGFDVAPNLELDSIDLTPSVDFSGLQHLRDYQKEGVQFAEANNGRIINADDVGLGKTLQTLAYFKVHPELRPIVIVCPAIVKYGWEREYEKHRIGGDKLHIIHGQKPYDVSEYDVLIINYDILTYWTDELQKLGVKILVSDESHRLNNSTSKRSIAFKALARLTPHIFALSATPITSYPSKFYTILNILRPDLFYNKKKFLWHFCGPKKNYFGWEYKGHTNSDELHSIVSEFMIRRKQSDVLKELPERTRQMIYIDCRTKEYDHLESMYKEFLEVSSALRKAKKNKDPHQDFLEDRIKELKEEGAPEFFMELRSKLSDVLYGKKKPYVMDFIQNYIDMGKKVVVYCTYKRTLDDVLDTFKNAALRIDGSTKMDYRQGIISQFGSDDDKMVLGVNISAVATGTDGIQHAASIGVIVNFPWEPSDCYQLEGRICRMGQKDPTYFYYMIGKDTIEADVMELIAEKDLIGKSVIDGEKVDISEFVENKIRMKGG